MAAVIFFFFFFIFVNINPVWFIYSVLGPATPPPQVTNPQDILLGF